jgi:hypothetical protein
MADCGLVRNPAVDIDREPMFKIFPEAHLGRINVSPLVAAIEQAI